MAAGLSPSEFNRIARQRLRDLAAQHGGVYRQGANEARFGDVKLTFRRINASNGEAAGILRATNTTNDKWVEGGTVEEMIEKAKTA